MSILWSEVNDDSDELGVHREIDEISVDRTSNDDDEDKSSSYRSSSVVSSRFSRGSHRRSRTNSSVMSRSDQSTNYSRFSQNRKVPSAESEGQILNLLAGSGYPMIQINGQRILGPPPGWTKPVPDPSCEVFVGKIPRDLHEDAIYPIFNNIGEIYEIRLMMDFSGTNRGYCFVMFTKFEYALRAIEKLNNWEIRKGRRIGVVASINNCRLCIGQLSPDIDTETVVAKFHEITDEVTKVCVYKNMNGQVRYALVSYRTHRGAAMARRRLLPERASLFEKCDVSIDWAHPGMSSNNMVEEVGVRDDNGGYKITTSVLGVPSKRCNSQRHGRDDFLEKSIKNYLQEKSGAQSFSNQRNGCCKPSETLRASSSSGRQRNAHRSRTNPRKSFDESRGRSKNNSCQLFSQRDPENRENEELSWRSKHLDVNDNNMDIPRNYRPITLDRTKNDLENHSQNHQCSNGLDDNFSIFQHRTGLPGIPLDGAANREQRNSSATNRDFILNSMKNKGNSAETFCGNSKNGFKTLSFSDTDSWMSTLNLSSNKHSEIPREVANSPRGDSSTNPRSQRRNARQANFDNAKIIQRSKNPTNSRVLSQITNYNGNSMTNHDNNRGYPSFTKNLESSAMKENSFAIAENPSEYPNSQRDFHNLGEFFHQTLNLAASWVPIDGSHVFNNYFRGINGRADYSPDFVDSANDRRAISLPFGRFVPQSLYGTSSFGDCRVPQVCANRGSVNPRPILSRMSVTFGDDISGTKKNHI